MRQTRQRLSETGWRLSTDLLDEHLATAIDLRGQVKQAHWNARGLGITAIHTLFDKVAAALDTCSDLIAERIGALGGTALGTVQAAAERSFLARYPLGIADGKQHMCAVVGALSAFAQSAHEAVGQAARYDDPGTAGLFVEISRRIDQQLWLIESHCAYHMGTSSPSWPRILH